MSACVRNLAGALMVMLPAHLALAAGDPLAGYYGNTVICRGPDGTDRGHLWIEPDGHYVLFASGPVRSGHFEIKAVRRDGAVELCLMPPAGLIRVPPAFGMAAGEANRFLATPCLLLGPHDIGDRWADPARPGRPGFTLAGGQQ